MTKVIFFDPNYFGLGESYYQNGEIKPAYLPEDIKAEILGLIGKEGDFSELTKKLEELTKKLGEYPDASIVTTGIGKKKDIFLFYKDFFKGQQVNYEFRLIGYEELDRSEEMIKEKTVKFHNPTDGFGQGCFIAYRYYEENKDGSYPIIIPLPEEIKEEVKQLNGTTAVLGKTLKNLEELASEVNSCFSCITLNNFTGDGDIIWFAQGILGRRMAEMLARLISYKIIEDVQEK